MIKFDVDRWVPDFILADKNGAALAKAIEAGVQAMNDCIKNGVKCLHDVDSMPEWRLDEVAWETNCYYDYKETDVEKKRTWVKNAYALSRIAGTPKALEYYMKDAFDRMMVVDNIDSRPFHFFIVVQGGDADFQMKDSDFAIMNVRSIFDGIKPGLFTDHGVIHGESFVVHTT